MIDEGLNQQRKRADTIVAILTNEYPDAKCTLDFTTPHQLLVAAILAAQCTDQRVNQITPTLFAKYPSVEAFAKASLFELQEIVKPTGFFRNKSISIIESANQIAAEHESQVPRTMEELTSLTGVGRKTANLILGVIYGQPAIIVDTHVKRVSRRLGLTKNTDPGKIEQDLTPILMTEYATMYNHLIVSHGRAVCKAPNPRCEVCVIIEYCPFGRGELVLK